MLEMLLVAVYINTSVFVALTWCGSFFRRRQPLQCVGLLTIRLAEVTEQLQRFQLAHPLINMAYEKKKKKIIPSNLPNPELALLSWHWENG